MQNSRDSLLHHPEKTWWKPSIYKDSKVSVGVNEVKNITMEKRMFHHFHPWKKDGWSIAPGSHVIGISCTFRLLGHNIPEFFFLGGGNSGCILFPNILHMGGSPESLRRRLRWWRYSGLCEQCQRPLRGTLMPKRRTSRLNGNGTGIIYPTHFTIKVNHACR